MKQFLKKIGFFVFPCLILIGTIIYLDFFKVFFQYDEYYIEDLFVSLNREHVCLKTIEAIPEAKRPDSFIFGSSRSQAFKCEDWKRFLPDSSQLFHFDAANEALIGISKKLEYLQAKQFSINNGLLIFDIGLLSQIDFESRNSSLTISHPTISDNSYFEFYMPFLSASINPKFLTSYFDYRVFRTHRPYMGQYIANTKYPNTINKENMDIFYGKEMEINEDSIQYYNKTIKAGIFYPRMGEKVDTSKVNPQVILILKRIRDIFIKNKTEYRIIISPMYDQVKFNAKYLEAIKSIFDNTKVYDFSGVNKWTSPLGSFYEKSHYRPHVARSIMREVYSN